MKTNHKTAHTVDCEAWSHYWAAKVEDSVCVPGAPPAVAAMLQDIWQRFFIQLPESTRILDLATGSGALLRLAQDCRPDLELTGVDYASSLPELGESVSMLSGVQLEDLPFADGAFNVVTSQFGLEYGSWPEAVDELNRILTPNGRLQLICHHSEGIIVAANRERLAAFVDITAGSGLLNGALKIVRLKKIKEPKSRRYLDRLLNKLHVNHPDQPVVSEVVHLVAEAMTQQGALKKLMSLRRDIEMEQHRIKALLAAALTPARVGDLQQMLTRSGSPVSCDLLYLPDTSTPLAWHFYKSLQ